MAGNSNDVQAGTFVGFAARFTLIGDSRGTPIADNGGNLIGTSASPIDPLLGPLADNGGPTQTHALLAGARRAQPRRSGRRGWRGRRTCLRPAGRSVRESPKRRIDMGSFELSVPMLVVDTLADENDGNYAAGDLSLREAIAFANGSINPETITFHPSLTSDGPATITLTQGDLQIRKHLTIAGPGASLLKIDALGNDPTPTINNGDGSRTF